MKYELGMLIYQSNNRQPSHRVAPNKDLVVE